MKNKDWMFEFPVIHFNEIVRRVKSNEYAKLFIHRMIKQGKIKRVTKGIYTTSNDIFTIASNIHYPGYISFLSASYRFGFTETIPRLISVVTSKKHKSIEFSGYTIEFISMKSPWGYHKEGKGTDVSFVADVEKLMLDAFLKPKSMGNFEEIEILFRRSEKINVEKICSYLKKLNSNKIYRLVGYLLEKHQNLDLSGLFPLDKNYYYLNPFKKGKKLNKKWRLLL